ncbi:hypothetical protein ACFL6Q_06440 [Candidatus Neomarinimicrobiota bacterium]
MREIKLFSAIVIFLIAGTLTAKPYNVSYRLGNSITGFQFLLKARAEKDFPGAFMPTLGLSYAGGSLSSEEESDYSEGTSSRTALTLLMPRVGFRRYRTGVSCLDHYMFAEIFYVIPLVNGEEDGEKMSSEEKEEIRDDLDVLGLSLGYGTEYHVSEQFSIGGELFFTGVHWSETDEGDYWSSKTRVLLGATIARATLNYYFQ